MYHLHLPYQKWRECGGGERQLGTVSFSPSLLPASYSSSQSLLNDTCFISPSSGSLAAPRKTLPDSEALPLKSFLWLKRKLGRPAALPLCTAGLTLHLYFCKHTFLLKSSGYGSSFVSPVHLLFQRRGKLMNPEAGLEGLGLSVSLSSPIKVWCVGENSFSYTFLCACNQALRSPCNAPIQEVQGLSEIAEHLLGAWRPRKIRGITLPCEQIM